MLASEEVFQDYTVATSLERYVTRALPVQMFTFDNSKVSARCAKSPFTLALRESTIRMPFCRFIASIEEVITSWINAGEKSFPISGSFA